SRGMIGRTALAAPVNTLKSLNSQRKCVIPWGNRYRGVMRFVRLARLSGSWNRRQHTMTQMLVKLLRDEQGQDIAEYAVMLAVILVIVVGTIRLIGSNANTVFSQVASSVQ